MIPYIALLALVAADRGAQYWMVRQGYLVMRKPPPARRPPSPVGQIPPPATEPKIIVQVKDPATPAALDAVRNALTKEHTHA